MFLLIFFFILLLFIFILIFWLFRRLSILFWLWFIIILSLFLLLLLLLLLRGLLFLLPLIWFRFFNSVFFVIFYKPLINILFSFLQIFYIISNISNLSLKPFKFPLSHIHISGLMIAHIFNIIHFFSLLFHFFFLILSNLFSFVSLFFRSHP